MPKQIKFSDLVSSLHPSVGLEAAKNLLALVQQHVDSGVMGLQDISIVSKEHDVEILFTASEYVDLARSAVNDALKQSKDR